MRSIELDIVLTDDLGIKSCIINYNDTELPNNSYLIEKIAIGLLKAIYINKDDILIQDLLAELNMKIDKKNF